MKGHTMQTKKERCDQSTYVAIWLKDVLDSNLFVLIFGSVKKSQISLKRVFKFAFLVAKLVAKLARICNVGHVLM